MYKRRVKLIQEASGAICETTAENPDLKLSNLSFLAEWRQVVVVLYEKLAQQRRIVAHVSVALELVRALDQQRLLSSSPRSHWPVRSTLLSPLRRRSDSLSENEHDSAAMLIKDFQ